MLGGTSSRGVLADLSHLDLVWLQTGHCSYHDIEATLGVLERETAAGHGLPVINSEVCYEGIGGG